MRDGSRALTAQTEEITRCCATLRAFSRIFITGAALCFVSACGTERIPLPDRDFPPPTLTRRGTEIGKCSWYGPGFNGQLTAAGEVYDQNALTAAHRTLPLGTRIEVTDRSTGRSIQVRVNDRGPYLAERMCDLSYGAARSLGMIGRGVVDAEIRVLAPRYASYPSVRYALQLGVFHNRADAETFSRQLSRRDLRGSVDVIDASPATYRVRVGTFTKRSDAAAAARKLRRRGIKATIKEEAPPSLPSARRSPVGSPVARWAARGQRPLEVGTGNLVGLDHHELGDIVIVQR
jgi:rare lipoprotein A